MNAKKRIAQLCLAAIADAASAYAIAQVDEAARASQAFEIVRSVLQHPRCANCHIPENAPRQLDTNVPHSMNVQRGKGGHGATAMECATCHGQANHLQAMLAHNRDDKLVGWGWDPGPGRQPVPVPREQFVAAFKTWMDLGAPCPR